MYSNCREFQDSEMRLYVCMVCGYRHVEEEVTADDFFTGQGSAIAVHRLIAGIYTSE